MEIYIKPVKSFKAVAKKVVQVKDVAEVFIPGLKTDKFDNVILINISKNERKNYLITIMDIVKAITAMEPKAKIVNVGEISTVVEYIPNKRENNNLLIKVKVAIVAVILFFGAATAIMSFHADAEMPKIMEGYYKMFFSDGKEPYIMEIPYSIGLALGIIIFFNHFSNIEMSKDPTPIEVQITDYNDKVIKNQIEIIESQKGE